MKVIINDESYIGEEVLLGPYPYKAMDENRYIFLYKEGTVKSLIQRKDNTWYIVDKHGIYEGIYPIFE